MKTVSFLQKLQSYNKKTEISGAKIQTENLNVFKNHSLRANSIAKWSEIFGKKIRSFQDFQNLI